MPVSGVQKGELHASIPGVRAKKKSKKTNKTYTTDWKKRKKQRRKGEYQVSEGRGARHICSVQLAAQIMHFITQRGLSAGLRKKKQREGVWTLDSYIP